MRDRRAFVAGAAAVLAAGQARAAGAVTVFAAASLQEALTEAGAAWTAGSGTPVRFSFGASSALARQIDQGAPADLFLSADEDWMDWLATRRRIVPASRRDLLSNRLVLIAPKGSRTTLRIAPGMPLARALGGGRLAVADPMAVPAGKYARAALTSLGVWTQAAGRLLPADNVRTALAWVARGEAPLGIVYATDAKAEPRVRVVGLFPAASHPPIRYPGAVIAASRNGGAPALLDFLQGSRAAAVFRRDGFGVPARPA
ncbi:MAG: molybdate ABC transporter substrate-binding protein [Caulobacter sp.]|nr:molybdate ABC transporter substrate-binding protein [Caulobacter sp.]